MDSVVNNKNVIYGQDAKDTAAEQKKANNLGKQVTDRGTLITKSNNELNMKSFLKIMTAELKNLDPTSSQDNTQYVTQMAQFSSMQQMAYLNTTMSTYSYQALIGKGVTVDVNDKNGEPYTGIVKGVSKENNTNYLWVAVNENGKVVNKKFEASTLQTVIDSSDNTNSNMLLNSDFMAASNLANNKDNKVVILNTDDKGNKSIVKGTVKSAYLDNGVVKVRVSTYDSSNNESTTTTSYPYSYIVKAGNLTDEDMNVKVEDYVDTSATNTTSPNPGDKDYSSKAQMDTIRNGKTYPEGSKYDSVASSSFDNSLNKVNSTQNG